ncbi:hypothetical protein [Bradyrhizobium retamae]|uniref:hypothetical protein n=1 Tax=Bradyrhizobium retamae TaxID=1300035 RepID=UPI000A91B46F|nr:hypothetical protein [Bradyrhizobium retamae]
MKGLIAIAVAGLMSVAGILWFQTSPNVVAVKVTPMQPNPNMPTFKQMQDEVRREKAGR